MGNRLEVKTKKVIYMNNHQLLNDYFDKVREYKGYLIAYNSSHLVIFSPTGDLILSEEGDVFQVNYGCIAFQKDNVMGIYRYDGSIAVPFNFFSTYITDEETFAIQKHEGDDYIPYTQK